MGVALPVTSVASGVAFAGAGLALGIRELRDLPAMVLRRRSAA